MRISSTAAAGLGLAAFLGAAGLRASTVTEGSEAPNVAGVWMNSSIDAATLKDLRGYGVLLEFWGTG